MKIYINGYIVIGEFYPASGHDLASFDIDLVLNEDTYREVNLNRADLAELERDIIRQISIQDKQGRYEMELNRGGDN